MGRLAFGYVRIVENKHLRSAQVLAEMCVQKQRGVLVLSAGSFRDRRTREAELKSDFKSEQQT